MRNSKLTEYNAPLILFIIALTLYSLLPFYFPPYWTIVADEIRFARQVETNTTTEFFHPHHILYTPLIRLVWKGLNMLHAGWRAIYIMRWLSRSCMALVPALLYVIARRMNADKVLASGIGLLFTVGCSPWTFSNSADTVSFTAAIFLLIVAGLFYRKNNSEPDSKKIVLLGMLYGFNITLHQLQLIFLPALLAGMSGWKRGKRLKSMIVFTLSAGVVAALPYLIVIFLFMKRGAINNLYEVRDFLLMFYAENAWGHGTFESVKDSFRTLLLTQSYSFALDRNIIFRSIPGMLSIAATLATAAACLWGWFRCIKQWPLMSEQRWVIVFFSIAVFFNTWWEATCWDFWMLPWTVLLLGLTKLNFIPCFFRTGIIVMAIVFSFVFNVTHLALPRHTEHANPYYKIAESISSLPQNDRHLLMTSNATRFFYFDYWGNISNIKLIVPKVSQKNIHQKIYFIPFLSRTEGMQEILREISQKKQGTTSNTLLMDEEIYSFSLEIMTSFPELREWFLQHSHLTAQSCFEKNYIKIYLLK
jgi:hypothetical protein